MCWVTKNKKFIKKRIAKEVLPLIIGDTVIDYLDVVEVAKEAVRLSDALIEELKKK